MSITIHDPIHMMKYIKGQINDDCLFIRNGIFISFFVTNIGTNQALGHQNGQENVEANLISSLHHIARSYIL
jgi:hypothetical protein